MGFRFGSRKRKEKQPENEKNEKPKRVGKSKKDNDESNSRPPPVPGSLKSSENRNTAIVNFVGSHKTNTDTSNNIQSAPGNRTVLFRDNRFPDGTTMPRIPTTQPHITQPGADRDGRISPTCSIYSTGSLQAAFPSLASYPASYVPQTRPKPFGPTPRTRGRIHSDSVYRSVYGDPLPKPDYPLSNDGTGNSNRDSGLDTESRSSSGGKPAPTYIFENYPQPRSSQHQIYSHQSRSLSLDRPGALYKFSEAPHVLRPKGYQGNRETPNFYRRQRFSRPVNYYYDDTCLPSPTSQRWIRQKEDFEEETYRPRSTHPPLHCSSCSCVADVARTPRSASALRRIQLEDEAPVEHQRDSYLMPRKHERRFRRDDEEDYSTKSMSGGLPRNQPVRGRYFEEREEVDRYGRLPPVRRPISARISRRNFYDDSEGPNDNDDFQENESDYSMEDESDFQETSRNYVSRIPQPSFYEMSKDISLANRDTSVIRL
ncbi:unnamed protein product [Hymenolepis diminuta]|uniref:SH2 domain-containing protein n=1 Tax=Hymenolepis diminuta TaxID=6216 RepID=A0A0R3SYD2_HYMDI|nr:unnamed protein product [Hymenolepis diminuta]